MEGVVVVYFRESPNGRSGFFFLGNHPMEGVVVVYFMESPNGGSGFCFF